MDKTTHKRWTGFEETSRDKVVTKRRVYKELEKVERVSHPLNDRLKTALMLTNKDDGVKVTCLTGVIPKGEGVPEHTHEVHDIIFPLSGRGKIWIEGVGDLELRKGVLVHVPPGLAHRIFDVSEDLELFDVFSGPVL
jgi:quercetin dioxygenase-like cupin family protein